MIEKLSEYKITSQNGPFINVKCNTKIINTLVRKINKLVDAVNGILAAQEQYATIYNEDIVPMLTPQNEEPVDQYAEQRKWIGKACWFWNENCKQCGILTAVFDNNKHGKDDSTEEYPFQRDSIGCWQHCEPVKPDDDIIFKESAPTDNDLRNMMKDPKYWRDKDPETVRRVEEGFKKLYGDKGE